MNPIHWDWPTFAVYLLLMTYFVFSTRNVCSVRSLPSCAAQRKGTIRLVFWALIPICFAVLRYVDPESGIGGSDMGLYLDFFEQSDTLRYLKGFSLLSRNNPLFYLLLYVVRSLTDDYHWMFVLFYSVIVFSQYYFFYKLYSGKVFNYAPLFYLLFFFLRSFSLLKFMFGVSLVGFSYVAMSEEKYIRAFIWAILSVLVHSSLFIIVFGLALYVFFKKVCIHERRYIVLFVLLSYALLIILSSFLRKIVASSDLGNYLETEQNIITSNLTTILCCGLCLALYPDIVKSRGYNPLMLFLVVFDLACIPIQHIMVFFRLHYIFILPRLYMWGCMFDVLKNKIYDNGKLIFSLSTNAVMIGWTIFRLYKTYETANLMPYVFKL